jgi:hypothetical protein
MIGIVNALTHCNRLRHNAWPVSRTRHHFTLGADSGLTWTHLQRSGVISLRL